MKRQIRPRPPRQGIHELAMRALADVAAGTDAFSTDDALSYDPYRKFK
jgi:hypothetical protein